MIKKKENGRISALVFFILILSSASILNSSNIKVFFHNTYENLMSKDPGFSSSRNLIDEGGNQENLSIAKRVVPLIKNFKPIAQNIINKPNQDLDSLEILIKFKNYKKILNDRDKSIERGFLEGPDEVNGQIKFGDEIYNAKFRLKGDLDDHWISNKRFSLRVRLKDGETIYGMNSFSVQKPRSRQHPYEQAFQEVMAKSSNLSLTTRYIKVSLNGDDWGIMNIEEHFSKEFLEKKQKKESLIFRFSDDRKWKNYDKSTSYTYSPYLLSDPRLHGTIYNSKKYLQNEHFRKVYSYVLEKRILDNHNFLYSQKEHLRLFYSALIWFSFHTLSDHNTKYYFNPYTLKLSPISSDQDMFMNLSNDFIDFTKKYDFNLNYRQIFKNSVETNIHNQAFQESLNAIKKAELYLNQFSKIFPLDLYKNTSILEENQKKIFEYKDILFKSLQQIDNKEHKTDDIYISDEQSKYLLDHLHIRHFTDGSLEFFNLLPFDVTVEKIFIDDVPLDIESFKIPGFKTYAYSPYKLKTSLVGIYDSRLDIESSFGDSLRRTKVYPSMIKNVSNPLEIPTSSNVFLTELRPNDFQIEKGNWNIENPLVINGNLSIEAGTILNFSEDSYLIVKGNISFIGKEDEKIQFVSTGKSWKGFYLISDGDSKSKIMNLVVKNTSATQDGILNLTGGFSIYNSNISIQNLYISDSKAEDSINIINSKINIDNLIVENSISDGFDCDFCSGAIKNLSFNEIGGDAIDFSGSSVNIYNANISNVKDKAISVGEKSYIKISDSSFLNVGVGVASKDSSETYLSNSVIKDFELYAVMTYQKKKIFGSESYLYLKNIDIEGDNPYISQKGTNLFVNDVKISEADLNVEEMYSQGVMKK